MDGLKLPPVVANVLAVATLSIIDFILADRWIFQVAVTTL
jgi:putative flippase GtrA